MKRSSLITLVVAPLLLAGCMADGALSPSALSVGDATRAIADGPTSYVIDFTGTSLPATLTADIEAAGGTVTASMDAIGVAVASSSDPDFRNRAAKLAGVRTVSVDRIVEWVSPSENSGIETEADALSDVSAAAAVGSMERFRKLQWNVDAVSAPGAWAAGQQGAGARVAVIDGGINSTHIDIASNLDAARSRSFAPGAYNSDVGAFWHGTHVAGIIAAPANNIGTVGVAPKATIIGVKALHNGSGAFSWIINAIFYAATPIAKGGAGAHIINMSLGAGFEKTGPDLAGLTVALSKATSYAYQQGVTVIASAGNSGADLDHTNNLIFVPAQSTHVIAVSATGPMGFGRGAVNFDRPASYTNFGQSAINLAGPGGDFMFPGNAPCTLPLLPFGSITRPCWVFDLVLSPSGGGWFWAAGTSMSSPAVAGVAALIVGKHGAMPPAQLEARLRASADDLGKPGNDDYYGRGRVNALRAIQ